MYLISLKLGSGIIFYELKYEFLSIILISYTLPIFAFLIIKYIFGKNDMTREKFIKFLLILGTVISILTIFEKKLLFTLLVNIVSGLIIIMMCEIVILKNDMLSAVVSSLVTCVIFETLKFVLNFILLKNRNKNTDFDQFVSVFRIIIILVIIALIVVALYRKFDKFVKRLIARKKESYFKAAHILIATSIVVLNLWSYVFVKNQNSELLFLLNLSITGMYCLFSLGSINIFNKYEKNMAELEYQYCYNKTLNYLMKDLRRFKHDYNNMLAVIGGYLQLNNYEELNNYYNNISTNIKYSNFEYNKSMVKIKDAGVLGLLLYKLNLAKGKGVEFIINVNTSIEKINMKTNEFCEILGILLDNAIEAASETKAKKVKLEVSENLDCKIFVIINSIESKIDTKKIYISDYSTKGKNRGVGLSVVNDLVKINKNLYLYTECSDEDFIQKLIIHCENTTVKKEESTEKQG